MNTKKQQSVIAALRNDADTAAKLLSQYNEALETARMAEDAAAKKNFEDGALIGEMLAAERKAEAIHYKWSEKVRSIVEDVEHSYNAVPYGQPRRKGIDACLQALGIR